MESWVCPLSHAGCCFTADLVVWRYDFQSWGFLKVKSVLTRKDINCPGCEGCQVYLGQRHLPSVLVEGPPVKGIWAHMYTHTQLKPTWGVYPGPSKLLVGLACLGGGSINLWPGWGGMEWEGAPLFRGSGMVRGSLTLWYQVQGGGAGWGCQWGSGFSLSTCLWSWARVLWGAARPKPWGEPEGLCPGWPGWRGIPWKPPSWLPGGLSTTKEPEGTRTRRED